MSRNPGVRTQITFILLGYLESLVKLTLILPMAGGVYVRWSLLPLHNGARLFLMKIETHTEVPFAGSETASETVRTTSSVLSSATARNVTRLKAIMAILGITITDAAKIAQVSRPYLSRILNGGEELDSNRVFHAIDIRLHALVAMRTKMLFELVPAKVENAEALAITESQRRDSAS